MDSTFGLIKISFSCGSSTGSLTQRFKNPVYHGCVLQSGAIRIRREIHSCFIFRGNLEIILKRGNPNKDPYDNFASLYPSLDCKGLDARLYIEVDDGIDGKQIYLLLENLVIEKRLENLWDEEATLESLFFSLNPCLLLYSLLKAGILL